MKLFFVILVLLGATVLHSQQGKSPRLVVGIVVDQMCYDYLYRFYPKFCEGGFKRLMEEGANCRNAQYNYVPTYTGPGHASIYTGTTPAGHGIVGNDWYDRSTGKLINCVDDSTVTGVGSLVGTEKFSPRNLKTLTITDQLKMTYPTSKVVAVSFKNRGAILPGGHLSDGSYWFDYKLGKMITSSYFKRELPGWVSAFNEEGWPDKYCQQKWETLLPIDDYAESLPDNSHYEHVIYGKTAPTFPYELKAMKATASDYGPFAYTPFANTYLTDFALAGLQAEGLGKDDQTDVLCISYSTPDIAGHAFGPYSVEIEDMYMRLDLELKKLMIQLDKQVGEGEYVLFLTADHAVVPVPQYFVERNMPGGYVFFKPLFAQLDSLLTSKWGSGLIRSTENEQIYLNEVLISKNVWNQSEIESFIVQQVSRWKGVKNVYTRTQLMRGEFTDLVAKKLALGLDLHRSGNIIVSLEPGYLPKSAESETSRKGTSHGSAYSYDAHVPLLFYGKGIKPVEINRQVEIVDIAPTLANILFVQNPSSCTGQPILEVLDKR